MKTAVTHPTIVEMVAAMCLLLPAPGGALQSRLVEVCHVVVRHIVEPNRIVGVRSTLAKFMPPSVIEWPAHVGPLKAADCKNTGASYVKPDERQPTNVLMFTKTSSEVPYPNATAHRSVVSELHEAVSQLVLPTVTVAVRSSAAKFWPLTVIDDRAFVAMFA